MILEIILLWERLNIGCKQISINNIHNNIEIFKIYEDFELIINQRKLLEEFLKQIR